MLAVNKETLPTILAEIETKLAQRANRCYVCSARSLTVSAFHEAVMRVMGGATEDYPVTYVMGHDVARHCLNNPPVAKELKLTPYEHVMKTMEFARLYGGLIYSDILMPAGQRIIQGDVLYVFGNDIENFVRVRVQFAVPRLRLDTTI